MNILLKIPTALYVVTQILGILHSNLASKQSPYLHPRKGNITFEVTSHLQNCTHSLGNSLNPLKLNVQTSLSTKSLFLLLQAMIFHIFFLTQLKRSLLCYLMVFTLIGLQQQTGFVICQAAQMKMLTNLGFVSMGASTPSMKYVFKNPMSAKSVKDN